MAFKEFIIVLLLCIGTTDKEDNIMVWPSASDIDQQYTDQTTDDPADARAEINKAMGYVNDIIDARGAASGIAPLNSSSKIDTAYLGFQDILQMKNAIVEASNGSLITVTNGLTTITTTNGVVSVTTNDLILASLYCSGTKGGTAGLTRLSLYPTAGSTATVRALHSSDTYFASNDIYLPASTTGRISQHGFFRVTGAGSLDFMLRGISFGSDWSVAIGDCHLSILVFSGAL